MNRFDYSKHRRLKEGLLWETSAPPASEPLYVRLVDAAVLLVAIAGIIALLCVMQKRDYEDQVRIHQEQAQAHEQSALSYGSTLAACMNGGALWDALNETVYFCSKPLVLKAP